MSRYGHFQKQDANYEGATDAQLETRRKMLHELTNGAVADQVRKTMRVIADVDNTKDIIQVAQKDKFYKFLIKEYVQPIYWAAST